MLPFYDRENGNFLTNSHKLFDPPWIIIIRGILLLIREQTSKKSNLYGFPTSHEPVECFNKSMGERTKQTLFLRGNHNGHDDTEHRHAAGQMKEPY